MARAATTRHRSASGKGAAARTAITRHRWSSHVESMTLRTDERVEREAVKVFRRLPLAEQMRLACEIVETRARELCIAYTNVVMLAAGFKTRDVGSTKARIVKVPCVTFIVRRKWKGTGRGADRVQLLPSFLLTHVSEGEDRRLCAVPTDVVAEGGFFSARVQAPAGIATLLPNDAEIGNATCAVRVTQGGQSTVSLMSCQHVLTPDLLAKPATPRSGLQVALHDGTRTRFAVSSKFGGQVRPDGQPSFDVQLADLQPGGVQALRAALDGARLSPGREFIRNVDDLLAVGSGEMSILISPNLNNPGEKRPPVRATFLRLAPNVQGIVYRFIFGPGDVRELPVNHRLLLMLRQLSGARTDFGDSGSPVVIAAPGGGHTLVGMHIAGGVEDGFDYSYTIPAWMLFNPFQYSRLPDGATLAPFNP